jgi:hypothetical protein
MARNKARKLVKYIIVEEPQQPPEPVDVVIQATPEQLPEPIALNVVEVVPWAPTLLELAGRIREEHAQCLRHSPAGRKLQGRGLLHAIRAGRLLAEARGSVPRGRWTDYLTGPCGLSAEHARKYVRVARDNPPVEGPLEPVKAPAQLERLVFTRPQKVIATARLIKPAATATTLSRPARQKDRHP